MPFRNCLLAAVLISGCYEYLPSGQAASMTGRRVQVTLSDVGSAALAKEIGPQIDEVGGVLIADSADVLQLSVNSVRHRNGLESGWNGERVDVPRGYIERLEERRFSRPRTVLASAVLMASLFIAQRAFGGAGGANAPGGTSPGTGSGK